MKLQDAKTLEKKIESAVEERTEMAALTEMISDQRDGEGLTIMEQGRSERFRTMQRFRKVESVRATE